ncbi:hypothetical protein Q5705_05185 [Kosakonia sp. H02]|nr:hypothetical protein Q5705_05185 [Kosakonia sp. H02]
MSFNLDTWLALPPPVRVICWLASALCGLSLVWWLSIRPIHNAQAHAVAQQMAQHSVRQAQWRKLRALSLPVEHSPLPDARRFSPLDFQAQDRQLIRWQPAPGGGELVLETRWQRVVETFPLLAERGMLIPAFSLVASEERLQFTLQLEHDND